MDQPAEETLRQEAARLRKEMDRLEQELQSVHPFDRAATDSEQREIDRLWVEMGRVGAGRTRRA